MVSGNFLAENKVIVSERRLADQLASKGFGERKGHELILDLFEAINLIEKEKLNVKDLKGKKLSAKKLLELGLSRDKKFYSKLIVFKELREKGFVVRTGLKFGSDFRVYPKGKNPGQEHTQWIVNVLPEETKFSLAELSRLVRLSQNLKTTALLAVVDSENYVNFYEMKRIVP